jgi:hypothetical protein
MLHAIAIGASILLSAAVQDIMIVGRISTSEVGPYQGAAIAVYRVGREGALERISIEKAESDGEGRYHVTIQLESGQTPDLLVEATYVGAKGRGLAVVPSWSAVDRVLIAPAIDQKSELESRIYLEMTASNKEPALGANALRRIITPRIAAELRASHHPREDNGHVATAVIDATEAWRAALVQPDLGLHEENVALAFDALDWAQVMLDAELYAADTPGEQERAHANYAAVVGAAYASAGIGPEHLAQAAQASADALRKGAQKMRGRMRAALISEAEALRARYVTGAVEALFAQMGAPEVEQRAVRSAGARLEGRTFASVEAGQDIDQYLKLAWNEYRRAILIRLRSVTGGQQEQRLI